MKKLLAIGLALLICGCAEEKKEDYSVAGSIKALKDKDPNVRYEAAKNLGKYGPEAKEAVPALIEALKDEDKTVRIGAAYALANIGPEAAEAVPALKVTAAKDKDKKVREGAQYALQQIQGSGPGKKP